MISLKLPDGSKKKFPSSIKGEEVAKSIGSSLLKSAVAISINGELRDLDYEIKKDSEVEIIENCGHMILLEEASKALSILKKFIRKNHPVDN